MGFAPNGVLLKINDVGTKIVVSEPKRGLHRMGFAPNGVCTEWGLHRMKTGIRGKSFGATFGQIEHVYFQKPLQPNTPQDPFHRNPSMGRAQNLTDALNLT